MILRVWSPRFTRLLAGLALVLVAGSGCAAEEYPAGRELAPVSAGGGAVAPSPTPAGAAASPIESVSPGLDAPAEGESGASDPAPKTEPSEMAAPSPSALTDIPDDPHMPTAAPVTSASAAPSGGAFTSDNCLFVEIVEERVLKSTSGGQTTSFAGEKTAYSYDSVAGTLAGAVEGTSAGDAMTIVGRTVVNQIDRTRVAAGRLYVLSADSRTFGPVAVQIPAPDGTVTVSIDGEMVTLSPGESISVDLEAAGEGETVSIGQAQRTVTVSNHGFLLRANLSAATP